MKNALRHELKQGLLPLVIFSAVSAVVCIIYSATQSLEYPRFDAEGIFAADSCVMVSTAVLAVLCTVTPVMQFSYRMKKRSVDLWYSLPVSRTRLAAVKTVGGLVLTLVPYTVGFWLTVIVVAARGAHFAYEWYLPLYFLSLVFGAGLFGVNAFLFTRGNTIGDGIVFLVLWGALLPMFVFLTQAGFYAYNHDVYVSDPSFEDIAVSLFTYSPITVAADFFDAMIRHNVSQAGTLVSHGDSVMLAVALPVGAVESVAAYVALFLRAERDRAENVGQISASPMGYKVLIPVYGALMGAMGRLMYVEGAFVLLLLALTLIGEVVLYFAYRRSFRLKRADVISIAVSLVIAVALFFALPM